MPKVGWIRAAVGDATAGVIERKSGVASLAPPVPVAGSGACDPPAVAAAARATDTAPITSRLDGETRSTNLRLRILSTSRWRFRVPCPRAQA